MDLPRKLGSIGLIFLFKSQDECRETFHELVNHGNLNRNEGENQNPLRPSQKNTGDTDDCKARIDGLNQEKIGAIWVIGLHDAPQREFRTSVRVQENQISNSTSRKDLLSAITIGTICFARARISLTPSPSFCCMPCFFQSLDNIFFDEGNMKIAVSSQPW